MRITEEEFLKADYLPIYFKNKTKRYPFIVYDMNAHPLARIWKSQRKNIVYCIIKKRYFFLVNDYEGNEDRYSIEYFKAMITYIRNTKITSFGFIFRAFLAFIFFVLVMLIMRLSLNYALFGPNIWYEIFLFSLLIVSAISFTYYYVHITEQKQMTRYVNKVLKENNGGETNE